MKHNKFEMKVYEEICVSQNQNKNKSQKVLIIFLRGRGRWFMSECHVAEHNWTELYILLFSYGFWDEKLEMD